MKMKTITLAVVLPLCFLFSAITAKPLFAVTGKDKVGQAVPVLDTNGEEVLTNQSYYVKACLPDGLTVAYTDSSHLYVAQDFIVNLPLEFTPSNQSNDVVYTSTDLYIKFAINQCSNCSKWNYDPNLLIFCVHVGEAEGVFQIIQVDDKYKFAVYDGLEYVDIYVFNNPLTCKRNLCTSGETFLVEFVKGGTTVTSQVV